MQTNSSQSSDEVGERIGALNALVVYHTEKGRYREAINYATRSADLIRQVVGEEHPFVATVISTLAGLHSKIGDYAAAKSLNQQALQIRRAALGEQHPDFATSLNNLATVHDSLGDYSAAEPLYKQALEVRRKALGEQHPAVAISLGNLADLYQSVGNYEAAEPLYWQALGVLQQTQGEEHPDVAASLNNLATFYSVLDNYAAAEPLIQRAISIQRDTLGEEHPDFAQSLNNLGMLYCSMGDYDSAERLLKQALEIRRKVLGEKHADFATTLDNLAGVYDSMRNHELAESLYRQAFEIRRRALGEAHPILAVSLDSLATLSGSFSAAEPLLKKALEIRRQALGEQHPDFATSLESLAGLYAATGDYVAAEPLSKRALEIRRNTLGEQHPAFVSSLNTLAVIFAATGRESEAMRLIERSLMTNDRMIGQIFSISSERRRSAYLRKIRDWVDVFLSLASQLHDSPEAVRSAFSLVLRRKSIEAEALTAQRDALVSGKYPDVAPRLKELRMLRARISKRMLAGPDEAGLAAHEQLLTEWEAQRDLLEAEIARQVPEMNLEQRLRGIDRQKIAAALPKDSALVEFVRFNRFNFKAALAPGEPFRKPAHYLAFVLPAGEPDQIEMIDLGEAELIDKVVASFRQMITGEMENQNRGLGTLPSASYRTTSEASGLQLHERLFTPLRQKLVACKRLLIAPDGDLALLPFEVLPTGRGGQLIDEYLISYLTAGRDVVKFKIPSTSKAARGFVMADPDFDLSATLTTKASVTTNHRARDFKRTEMWFDRLPGTRAEGENIAAMLKAELWMDKAAVKTRLKGCRSPCILHLSTHGFFLKDQTDDFGEGRLEFRAELSPASPHENPLLRSGLALAGVNTWLKRGEAITEAENGLLTAEDVTGLDLLDTELVVLSACETGLGEVRVGEGVFGLRRAFVLAGARTLVMSLWKVPDTQTCELMKDFYDRMLSGQPRADALRAAQLTMKAKYPEPFFWGAFICQGYDGPLSVLGRDTS